MRLYSVARQKPDCAVSIGQRFPRALRSATGMLLPALSLLIALAPRPASAQPAGEYLLRPHPHASIPVAAPQLNRPSPELLLLKSKALLLKEHLPPEVDHMWKNWRRLLSRHDPATAFSTDSCLMPSPVLSQWQNLTARIPAMEPVEKLRLINGFFNNWTSVPDTINYNTKEYWALPEEFLRKGGGDCEDFAIIKYMALRYFSWPPEDLWILLLYDRLNQGRHAVLATRVQDRVFILDNLSKPAYLLIPEQQYAEHVSPIYAVNELGLWRFISESEERDYRPDHMPVAGGQDSRGNSQKPSSNILPPK
ncbi:MAG: transglutaminase-like cysteine peptidase [Desulfovibrio sp.]|nr:transglutaminase-like cysteine peptidase [Desulfovibrio sp.]